MAGILFHIHSSEGHEAALLQFPISQAYVCRRVVLSIFIPVHFPCRIDVLNVRVGILFHIHLFEIIGYVIHPPHI